MGIAEIFEQMDRERTPDRREQKIDNEALIHRLREHAERYARSCPFTVGQLVTPTSDGPNKGHGIPEIVLDVRDTRCDFTKGDPCTNTFGLRLDMRILKYHPDIDSFSPFWVDSASYEAWEK